MRRFLSRAEALTLLGMGLVFLSLFLTWEEISPKTQTPLASMAAFVAPTISRNGFGLPRPLLVLLVFCTALSSAALLITLNRNNKLVLTSLQGVCGLGCLLISLRYIALLPGVGLAIVGSACLLYAAADRWTEI